jgi:hypothetical protein
VTSHIFAACVGAAIAAYGAGDSDLARLLTVPAFFAGFAAALDFVTSQEEP